MCECKTLENQCEANTTLIGDGYCNDIINVPECNFDGGDCCGGNLDLCMECRCFEDETSTLITIEPQATCQYLPSITQQIPSSHF